MSRSDPLEKSEKNILAYISPPSTDSKIVCSKYTKACVVDLPRRANYLLSNLSQTHMTRDLAEKPSSTLATGEVNDTSLKSLSTDIGG